MGTRNRAILIILLVILSLSATFITISLYEYKQNYQEKITHHQEAISYLVESEFQKLTRSYVSRLDGFIKSNTRIIEAFESRNRDRTIELLSRRFSTFTKENPDFSDIRLFLPDGRLFLSMEETNNYGTDMSAYSFIETLKSTSAPLYGFTISNNKLFFQTAKAIIINGKKIGMLEFRIQTNTMNSTISKVLNAEYGLSIAEPNYPTSKVTVIDQSSPLYQKIPDNFDYNKKIQNIIIGESEYIIHTQGLYDFRGEKIGYYLTSNDITNIKKRFHRFFIYTLIITAIVIILSSWVLYIGFGTILKKIELMNIELESKIADRTKELEEAKNNALEQNKVISSLYKRFKSMFQDHRSIMFLISPESGRIVDANIAAVNFLQMDKKDILKLKIADISLLAPERVAELMSKSAKEGLENYISKFRFNEDIVDLEIQASPIDIDGHKLLFTICHDVTEKVLMEQKLKELNKNLEMMVQKETDKRRSQEFLLIQQSKMSSVGELLSAIIHQWRQPITAISYLMQDLADAAQQESSSKEYITSISQDALVQINYMNQTVDDFRKFLMPSKTQEKFNAAEEIVAVLKMLNKQLEKEEIKLNLTIVNASAEVQSLKLNELCIIDCFTISISCFNSFGYPNEFKQVLMNLINNARDAIIDKQKEAALKGSINIVISCMQQTIEISISDNAGGIPANIMDRIFEPYFTTKSTKGTGIGLYMAKSIIENHMNGTVKAENSGKGALFTINLKKSCGKGPRPDQTQKHSGQETLNLPD